MCRILYPTTPSAQTMKLDRRHAEVAALFLLTIGLLVLGIFSIQPVTDLPSTVRSPITVFWLITWIVSMAASSQGLVNTYRKHFGDVVQTNIAITKSNTRRTSDYTGQATIDEIQIAEDESAEPITPQPMVGAYEEPKSSIDVVDRPVEPPVTQEVDNMMELDEEDSKSHPHIESVAELDL